MTANSLALCTIVLIVNSMDSNWSTKTLAVLGHQCNLFDKIMLVLIMTAPAQSG